EDVFVVVGKPLDEREMVAALQVEERAKHGQCPVAQVALPEIPYERIRILLLEQALPCRLFVLLFHDVDERFHGVLQELVRRFPGLVGEQIEIEQVSAEFAPANSLALQIDQRVLVVHGEWPGLQLELLLNQVLDQGVLERKAHRTKLSIHVAGKTAICENTAPKPILTLENGDLVACILQLQTSSQASHACPDDHNMSRP